MYYVKQKKIHETKNCSLANTQVKIIITQLMSKPEERDASSKLKTV